MEDVGYYILYAFIVLLVWLACREIVCWYYKLNDLIDNQKVIISLLQELVSNAKNIATARSSKLAYADFVDKNIQVLTKDGTKLYGRIVPSMSSPEHVAIFVNASEGIKKVKVADIDKIEERAEPTKHM